MRQYIDALNETALPEAAGDTFNYDLKAKYAEFNDKYFGGELPECKLRFGVLKNAGGHCTCKTVTAAADRLPPKVLKARGLHRLHGAKVVPGSLAIVLSTTYQKDHTGLDQILLHEMIHAWFYSKNMLHVDHGKEFLEMRAKVSKMSGIDVPLRDDTRNLELSDDVGLRSVAVLIYRKNGEVNYALVNANAMRNVKHRALEKVKWIDYTRRSKNLHVTMKIVTGPWWTRKAMTMTVQRYSAKTIYRMKPADMASAMAEFETGEEVFDYYGDDAAAAAAKADPRNAGNYD